MPSKQNLCDRDNNSSNVIRLWDVQDRGDRLYVDGQDQHLNTVHSQWVHGGFEGDSRRGVPVQDRPGAQPKHQSHTVGHCGTGTIQVSQQSILQRSQWHTDRLWCHRATNISWRGVLDETGEYNFYDIDENLNLNEVVLMVVGNKVDLEADRKVPAERVQKEYKEKFDIDCW